MSLSWCLNTIIMLLAWWDRYQRYRERQARAEAQLPGSALELQAAQQPYPQVCACLYIFGKCINVLLKEIDQNVSVLTNKC